MSWLQKIENDLIITTGDGEQYTPSWLNASFQKDYNIAEFNFPNLSGTLVRRNKPMGRKYQLELYFTGADHLDTVADFSRSADDERPWRLEHPLYGLLIVQPISISVDNSAHNVSRVTIPVIETITEENPKIQTAPVETIAVKKELLDETFAGGVLAEVQPADITDVKEKSARNFNLAVPVFKIPGDLAAFIDIVNKANSAVNNAIAFATAAMRAVNTMISYPARLKQSVKSRVNLLRDQFETLRNNVEGLTGVASKQIYQNQAGTAISSIALAMVLPSDGDYKSSTEALDTIDTLTEVYNTYMADLDFLQSDNGGNPNSFIPDAGGIIALNELVNLTISNLFMVALGAKKERSIILGEDTNIVLLTHRLYSLDPSDANMQELMDTNNIGLSTLLMIKKGTKITYFV